jgi:hypothetical protein
MRVLRAHHINKFIEVVDSFLPRAAANPLGGTSRNRTECYDAYHSRCVYDLNCRGLPLTTPNSFKLESP